MKIPFSHADRIVLAKSEQLIELCLASNNKNMPIWWYHNKCVNLKIFFIKSFEYIQIEVYIYYFCVRTSRHSRPAPFKDAPPLGGGDDHTKLWDEYVSLMCEYWRNVNQLNEH